MSPKTMQIVVSAVLILHGIGHVMGILPAAGLLQTESWHSRSWLLTGALGDPTSKAISIVLWAVLTVAFVAAGAGALGWSVTQGSWRTIALAAAVVSLVSLALFWNSFVTFFPNKVGAIAVNVAIIYGVLWAHWPATDLIP